MQEVEIIINYRVKFSPPLLDITRRVSLHFSSLFSKIREQLEEDLETYPLLVRSEPYVFFHNRDFTLQGELRLDRFEPPFLNIRARVRAVDFASSDLIERVNFLPDKLRTY